MIETPEFIRILGLKYDSTPRGKLYSHKEGSEDEQGDDQTDTVSEETTQYFLFQPLRVGYPYAEESSDHGCDNC